MIAEKIPQISQLDAAEKLLLVTELWDSLAGEQMEIPVSDRLLEELDSRLAEYRRNPGTASPREEAEERIRTSR